MSRCFTWFPISGLGEPNIYHDLGDLTRIVDFTWKNQDRGVELYDRDFTNLFVPNFQQLSKGGVNVYSYNDGDSSPFWFGEESPLVKKFHIQVRKVD